MTRETFFVYLDRIENFWFSWEWKLRVGKGLCINYVMNFPVENFWSEKLCWGLPLIQSKRNLHRFESSTLCLVLQSVDFSTSPINSKFTFYLRLNFPAFPKISLKIRQNWAPEKIPKFSVHQLIGFSPKITRS